MDIALVLEILKRVGLAVLCGICVGFERDVHGRAAGLRTHILVASGAALFTVMSLLCAGCSLDFSHAEQLTGDAGRIAAQVVSGIGFMGAGTIVKTGVTVRGLTTAACLWFAAALGMACGINQATVALISALGATVIVFMGKRIEARLHRQFPFLLIVEADSEEAIEEIRKYISANPMYSIGTLNMTIAVQPRRVKAVFHIDTDCKNQQLESCMTLTVELSRNIPGVHSVSYQSEG